MRRSDGDEGFGGRERQQLLYGGWRFVDDGQDWIVIVKIPAQRDDGSLFRQKDGMTVLASGVAVVQDFSSSESSHLT